MRDPRDVLLDRLTLPTWALLVVAGFSAAVCSPLLIHHLQPRLLSLEEPAEKVIMFVWGVLASAFVGAGGLALKVCGVTLLRPKPEGPEFDPDEPDDLFPPGPVPPPAPPGRLTAAERRWVVGRAAMVLIVMGAFFGLCLTPNGLGEQEQPAASEGGGQVVGDGSVGGTSLFGPRNARIAGGLLSGGVMVVAGVALVQGLLQRRTALTWPLA
jgi:hypothetical protein